MAQLSTPERMRLLRLSLDRGRRGAAARVLGSGLLRRRYGAPFADEVLIVPQDLRTADPSFASEIAQGHFGLGGRAAYLATGSPFDLRPPSEPWARELHGFSWLHHLSAAANPRTTRTALVLVADWVKHARGRTGIAWEPAVVGRRVISWLSNANLLLEGVDQVEFDRTANSLAEQLVHLSATWREAPEGYPRLISLIALAYGNLCIGGRERQLGHTERLLSQELARQILPDGGHANRNPATLVELMLDLLPLRQCFIARQRPIPKAIDGAIGRALPMLRFLRLGDGSLARFNGMGTPSLVQLATVLAYDSNQARTLADAPSSSYARMERGGTVLVADVGPPPSLELAAHACAGCLAFELSLGSVPVLVNGGAPGPAEQDRLAASRATASHNTLCLSNKSSSRLVRHPRLERLIGGVPIRLPARVTSSLGRGEEGDLLDATHDGYLAEFGLVHRRRLALAADGTRLVGRDSLGPPRGELRLQRDVPFAIHFHLHPRVACSGGTDSIVELGLRNGQKWRFSARGAQLSLEPSVHYADIAGPARSQQIVLRGATFGDTEVEWRLEQV